jgi:hypothetical protein
LDEPRIDEIAKRLSARLSRRGVIGGLGGGLVAVAGGLSRPKPAPAGGCKKVGKQCEKNQDCCDGAECKGGECACKDGRDECHGLCVKLNIDEANCGACDNVCAAGQLCCVAACVDPSANRNHCGACNVACGETERCVAGTCVPCPPGTTAIGNQCGTATPFTCPAETIRCFDTCCPIGTLCCLGACCYPGTRCVNGQCLIV